jgi:pyruvate dehydrogenase E1 component
MRDDPDPVETQEWLSALASVVEFEGVDRASSLLDELLSEGLSRGVPVPHPANTP